MSKTGDHLYSGRDVVASSTAPNARSVAFCA
jgi:hypothetical protein